MRGSLLASAKRAAQQYPVNNSADSSCLEGLQSATFSLHVKHLKLHFNVFCLIRLVRRLQVSFSVSYRSSNLLQMLSLLFLWGGGLSPQWFGWLESL